MVLFRHRHKESGSISLWPRLLYPSDALSHENRVFCRHNYLSAEVNPEIEETSSFRLTRELKAKEILDNLSEEEKLKLEYIKVEYEMFKAKLVLVSKLFIYCTVHSSTFLSTCFRK